ncbi:MAG: ATP-binding protein [Flammeovirgaceae bacterium]|nr:ATP-binding protein [Flammeovirgaceae bacterium]MDW8286502.1 ATP-binding protein [Flammeovirgaceae bacterium]
MNTIKIKIPSLLDNIRIVESFVEQAKERFQFNDDIFGNIMIAVTESVNNAIIHGNKQDKEKNVHLTVEYDKDNITFIVEDEGNGFDVHNLPDPTAPENINKIGGRGIFLIKNLADEVRFSDNGRKIKMVFYTQV